MSTLFRHAREALFSYKAVSKKTYIISDMSLRGLNPPTTHHALTCLIIRYRRESLDFQAPFRFCSEQGCIPADAGAITMKVFQY